MLDIDRQLPSVRAIGKPDPRRSGADPDVAAGGDAGAAAGAGAGDGRDRRHPDGFQRAQHPIDPRLIIERILRGLEGAELGNIGPGRKGFFAGRRSGSSP